MKRTTLTVLMVILTLISTYSQRRGSISGIVANEQSGERIPFASVALLVDEEFISLGTVSNDNGEFTIENTDFGRYNVLVSFIGFNTDTIKGIVLNKENHAINLGTIGLTISSIALNDVEVSAMASTSTSKIDRKTYRAEDFATARGGTAVDVLNKIPSVSVSPDGEVSLRGTTDFMVYLNGKPTQMEPSMLLGQLSGDAIQNIDIITVPSARYDSQGKGGIINITTKTTGLQGLSISANGILGGSPWANFNDKYDGYLMNDNRYNSGLNLMYGKERLSLYGGLNYSYKNVNGDRTGDARIFDESTGSYKHMVAGGERPEWYENFSANAGMDLTLSEATELSASYFFGKRTEGRSAFYVYNNFYGDREKQPVTGVAVNNEWIYNPNTDNRYGTFHTANIGLKQKLSKSSSLSATLLYELSNLERELDNYNYGFNKPMDQVEEVLLHYNQTDNTPLDGFLLSVNYSKTMDNGDVLGIGFQPQMFQIDGDFSYDTLGLQSGIMAPYSSLENGLDLSRGIYAGYIDYSGNIGNLQFMAGLRVEYTDQVMEIDNPDYFTIFDRPTQSKHVLNQIDWFPTFHAGYSLNKKSALNLAASRRISRPPIKNMAPFLYRRHLEVYAVGDPYLQPEYLTSAELGYDQKIGSQNITLTGFYRGVDNTIFRVNTVFNEEMVLIRSYTNSGNSTALGLELNANLVAGKSTKLFIGGSLYNYSIQGEVFGYKEDKSSTNWSLKGNATFLLGKQLKYTADFDIKSATVTSQGQNDLFYMGNMALNYTPKKLENWNFSLKVLDVLSSNIQGLNTRAFNENGEEVFYQETVYYRYGPIVEIGASFALNMNGNAKNKPKSSFGDKEF